MGSAVSSVREAGDGRGTILTASFQTVSKYSSDLILSIAVIVADISGDALSRSIDLSCSNLSVGFSVSSTRNAVFAMKTNSVDKTGYSSTAAGVASLQATNACST